MRAEGVFDVDANTSIDQLSEDLNIKMPEVYPFFYMQLAYLSSHDPAYLTGASVTFLVGLSSQLLLLKGKISKITTSY